MSSSVGLVTPDLGVLLPFGASRSALLGHPRRSFCSTHPQPGGWLIQTACGSVAGVGTPWEPLWMRRVRLGQDFRPVGGPLRGSSIAGGTSRLGI